MEHQPKDIQPTKKRLYINLEAIDQRTSTPKFKTRLYCSIIEKKMLESPAKTSINLNFPKDIKTSIKMMKSTEDTDTKFRSGDEPPEQKYILKESYEIREEEDYEDLKKDSSEFNKFHPYHHLLDKEKTKTYSPQDTSENLVGGFNLDPVETSPYNDDTDSYESSSIGSMSISEGDFYIEQKNCRERRIFGFREFLAGKEDYLNEKLDFEKIVNLVEKNSEKLTIGVLQQALAPKRISIGFKELCMLRFVEEYFFGILDYE